MGKFSRNKKYTFISLEEMICDIIEHFNEGMNIQIILNWEETKDFIIALVSTGKFIPYDINYAYPEINGYSYEYSIELTKIDDNNVIFVEPIWNEENEEYFNDSPESSDIVFISQDVNIELYNKYIQEKFNTVLFNIE